MTYHGQGLGVAEEVRTAARTAYASGQAAFEAGHYKEALTAFESAYHTIPNPVVLIAMAKSYERLGDTQRALLKYREYLWADERGPYAEEAQAAVRRLGAPATAAPVAIEAGARLLPSAPEEYEEGGATTVGVWVATGLGLAAIGLVAAIALRKPKRAPTTPNRRGRRRRIRR